MYSLQALTLSLLLIGVWRSSSAINIHCRPPNSTCAAMASVTCAHHQPDTFLSNTKRPYEPVTTERCGAGDSTTSTRSLHMPIMNNTNHHTSSSRPTSAATSAVHSRSGSHSTSRPTSRRSSLQARRTVPNAAIVPVQPVRSTPQERRESLLALHRESVRLFQDQDPCRWSTDSARPAASLRTYRRQEGRTSSEIDGSAPPSPILPSHYSSRGHSSGFEQTRPLSSVAPPPPSRPLMRDRSNTFSEKPVFHSPSVHDIPPTVQMEWTSASTRRREYEKIDRASRGMRGLWRRVAPRWCRTRDARTPFFEEGKRKPNREGSVRRFRMDLPDEKDCTTAEVLDWTDKSVGGRKRWPVVRSKTEP